MSFKFKTNKEGNLPVDIPIEPSPVYIIEDAVAIEKLPDIIIEETAVVVSSPRRQ